MDKRKNRLLQMTTEESRNFYRERSIELINRIESVTMLKKIYTVAKTLKDISK